MVVWGSVLVIFGLSVHGDGVVEGGVSWAWEGAHVALSDEAVDGGLGVFGGGSDGVLDVVEGSLVVLFDVAAGCFH